MLTVVYIPIYLCLYLGLFVCLSAEDR